MQVTIAAEGINWTERARKAVVVHDRGFNPWFEVAGVVAYHGGISRVVLQDLEVAFFAKDETPTG